MNDAPLIEVRDLWKTYRAGDVDVHALRGVNLSVAKGEFLAVVGPSGSGKSTLFHILGGLTSPSSGSVSIDGRNLDHLTNAERTQFRREAIGFIFQKYNLLPTLSAEDNIHLVQYVSKQSMDFSPEFEEVLRNLGINNRLKHKPRALSGGQQQRVAIARAIVNKPAILLADEPTGNLDSQNAIAVLDLLKELNQQLGQTILLITHDPDAASYGSRRIYMRDGQIGE
jgi:putative ABC transport system ATP-binding protein